MSHPNEPTDFEDWNDDTLFVSACPDDDFFDKSKWPFKKTPTDDGGGLEPITNEPEQGGSDVPVDVMPYSQTMPDDSGGQTDDTTAAKMTHASRRPRTESNSTDGSTSGSFSSTPVAAQAASLGKRMADMHNDERVDNGKPFSRPSTAATATHDTTGPTETSSSTRHANQGMIMSHHYRNNAEQGMVDMHDDERLDNGKPFSRPLTAATATHDTGGMSDTGATAKPKRKRTKRVDDEGPRDYIAGTYTYQDVLMGRGGLSNNHTGNQEYLAHMKTLQEQYLLAAAISEKTAISLELVQFFKDKGGRFMDCDKLGRWYEVSDRRARRRASQALRENIPPELLAQYRRPA